ncbi:reticulon-4-interacting protein 1, mitochondrial-like [Diadema antillarum]|uniref:reticulon-4-interacting protein 1, mitochondrial-like n=1 Tax=Diadema antillarum TaxID=105358 RepID=UPI003A874E4D
MNHIGRCIIFSGANVMRQFRMVNLSPFFLQDGLRALSTSTNPASKMLAWQVESYGGPDRLKLVETPVPIIKKPNQVLIEVYATSINPLDIRMRGGYGAALMNRARGVSTAGDELPLTLGRDCSGVIVDKGQGVKKFEVGEEVWAAIAGPDQGAHAKYALVNSNTLSRKPKNLSHTEAASIPYVAITTWSGIYAVAKFRPETAPDKRVLILGGSGGVGTFAIQLMKAWGCHVTTTCSAAAMDFVATFNPDNMVDYNKNPASELQRLGPFDLIFDTVGGDTESYAMPSLGKRSHYITLITPFLRMMDEQGAFRGSLSASWALFSKARQANNYGGKYRWSFATPNTYALSEVAKLAEEGLIKPTVERVFPFEDMPAAFANVETRSARGKTVVNVKGEVEVEVPKTADFYMS